MNTPCLLVLAAAALAITGCSQCRGEWFTDSSGGYLSGFESPAAVASWNRLDGGDASPAAVQVDSVTTHPFETCDGGPCVVVQELTGTAELPEIVVQFDLPPGPGSYRLEDLHGVVCDVPCAPVTGTVVVTNLTPACADGSCGKFDGALDVTATTGDGGPSITGTASLTYEQGIGTYNCGGFGPSGGG